MNARMPVEPIPFELELAQRCARGDRSAQHELFQQQRSQVHRTLFRIMGNNRQMEDLVQDTFIEVFGAVGSFAGRSSLATWIDTIAARVAYRHLSRRDPRAHHLYPVEDLATATDPEQEGRAREAMRRLYAILDRIEAKYRIAYTLHMVDGRSIRDVAQITGASTVAVKNRVWRAKRMVAERAIRDPILAEFLPKAGTQ